MWSIDMRIFGKMNHTEVTTYLQILSPVQTLQKEALDLSGLTYEKAFSIDNTKISSTLGELSITKLFETFFSYVYNDKEEWFRYV